jgi:hypothetical protein
MARLEDCPTEVILEICEQHCSHCRQKAKNKAQKDTQEHDHVFSPDRKGTIALAALSRCNRRIRDVAQPILFHHYDDIQLSKDSHTRDELRSLEASSLFRLYRFIETLLHRPDLATCLQVIHGLPNSTLWTTGEKSIPQGVRQNCFNPFRT